VSEEEEDNRGDGRRERWNRRRRKSYCVLFAGVFMGLQNEDSVSTPESL
jgi:hypothetical protein